MKLLIHALVVSLALTASAEAQDWRPERPYRALFGSGVGDVQQALTLSLTAGGGWDKNVAVDLNGRNFLLRDENSRFQGGATTGSAILSYSLNGERAAFGASGGTTARYYPRTSERVIRREYASMGATANLAGGVSAGVNASYRTYSLRWMLPTLFEPRLADTEIIEEDFPDSSVHYVSYAGTLGWNRQISRRQTLSIGYRYQGRAATSQTERYDRHGGSIRLTRALGRDLGFHIGYGYAKAFYDGNKRSYGSHTADIGIDYNKALSFSRRTTISFGTGTAASSTSAGSALRYRATGTARLNHEIGRSWNATIAYNRGLQFLDTWPEPIFSDSASAGVSGLLNARTQVRVMARALRGSAWDLDSRSLETYSGVASIGLAVTRNINTSLSYAYYRHDFSQDMALAPGFPSHFDGQTIRASVTFWTPLFQRTRRP